MGIEPTLLAWEAKVLPLNYTRMVLRGLCKFLHKFMFLENKKGLNQPLWLFGSPTWARTRDLRINSPALYRLSYRGIDRDYSVNFI